MTSHARTALTVAAVLLALHALAYVLWTEDDVGVSLRYVANLVEGRGLVYNEGERVEAISNLGLVLLLAPFYALLPTAGAKVGLLVIAKLVGLTAATLGLREAHRMARTVGLSDRAADVVPILLAGSTPYAAWAVAGLEVPLVALASFTLIAAAAERVEASGDDGRPSERRAAAAAAALVLLRVDGFVLPLAVLALLGVGGVGRRVVGRIACPAVVTAAVCAAFRYLYYGHLLPTPVAAKVDLASSLGRAWETLTLYIAPFTGLFGSVLLVATALGIALFAPSSNHRARRVVAMSVVAVFAYNLMIGKDWMPLYRFLVATSAPLLVLIVALLASLAQRLRLPTRISAGACHAGKSTASPVRLAIVLGFVAIQALAGHASFRTRRATPLWYLHPQLSSDALVADWTPAVTWLAQHVDSDGVLLTSEAGFIPYLSGLRTIDSYGLATPAIAQLPNGAVERSTLGVHAEFVAGAPSDPAQRYLSLVAADACVLQQAMVKTWNDGAVPAVLFDGRYVLDEESPVGLWSVFRPAAAP